MHALCQRTASKIHFLNSRRGRLHRRSRHHQSRRQPPPRRFQKVEGIRDICNLNGLLVRTQDSSNPVVSVLPLPPALRRSISDWSIACGRGVWSDGWIHRFRLYAHVIVSWRTGR
jgi:hypothetical protein